MPSLMLIYGFELYLLDSAMKHVFRADKSYL